MTSPASINNDLRVQDEILPPKSATRRQIHFGASESARNSVANNYFFKAYKERENKSNNVTHLED